MGSTEKNCYGIKKYNSDGTTEYFPVGKSYDEPIILCDSTPLGVTDSSNLGEELDFNRGASLGVSDLYLVGIPEGKILADSSKLGGVLGSR